MQDNKENTHNPVDSGLVDSGLIDRELIDRELITEIVAREWDMFTAVNEGGPRASCQEDRITFEGMRKAQFESWSPEAAESYLDDLVRAQNSGRNLIEEKYIHMMQTTEPAHYDALLTRVAPATAEARLLAKTVSDTMLEQTRLLYEDYPYVSGHGRPLYSTLDYGDTSVETYQLSELLTYSENTLKALEAHISTLESAGISLARLILENTVKFYGYSSLDKAEAATKERIEKQGFRLSFGCCAGEECEM